MGISQIFKYITVRINLTHNYLVKMKETNMYVCRMPRTARIESEYK